MFNILAMTKSRFDFSELLTKYDFIILLFSATYKRK